MIRGILLDFAIDESLSGLNKEIVIQFNKSKISAEKLKKKLKNYSYPSQEKTKG